MSAPLPAPGLSERAIEIVASLAQHRLLSTAQVRAIHLPDRTPRRTQQVLTSLEAAGLARHTSVRWASQRLWHLSEEGALVARASGLVEEREDLSAATAAAGALRAHTLAVNDAAICFLAEARERGDEFGPLSWHHEVAHPLSRGRGRRRRALVSDAVLTYLRIEAEVMVVEQRFLELDRATLSVDRLAAELARYARLYRARGERGEPLWRSLYPSFPAVLCVLAGAPRAALERRRDVALALSASDPELSRTPEAAIRACLLEDLRERGPFAPIFLDARDPSRAIDWLGRERR